ncbi:MAG: TIGR00269 family protein [Thermoplasmata archaeon HGW-Thermoplasmata-1]|nr:MAG: TIGR00269 family protein [Thermoplasmata archaeon HGW-Thermoplasmata-1]
MRCDRCLKPAVTFIRYNGSHLCSEHFIDYYEKRVKKEIKKQVGKLPQEGVVAVAVSGGKDSLVAMKILADLLRPRRKVKLHAITIDEGIEGYRPKSIGLAARYAKWWGVDHHVVSFKESVGCSLDEIVRTKDEDVSECGYCGVLRRMLMNSKARELGAAMIATGHNLDDVSQSILMNFVSGDIEKLSRLGPHTDVKEGLIPRIMPLRTVTEKENVIYALLNGIELHEQECPYTVNAHRQEFRSIVETLESRTPGTRHSIVKSYDVLKPLLLEKYGGTKINRCERCGEPTSAKVCKSCLLVDKLKRK